MPNIIGYKFEADLHCVPCTKIRHKHYPFALTDPMQLGTGEDENGIPYAAADVEGNGVAPIFSTDDGYCDDVCGDCFNPLWG